MEINRFRLIGTEGLNFLITETLSQKEIIKWLNNYGVAYPGQRIDKIPTPILTVDLAELLQKEPLKELVHYFDRASEAELALVKSLNKTELKNLSQRTQEFIENEQVGRILWALATDSRPEALKQIPKIINKSLKLIPSFLARTKIRFQETPDQMEDEGTTDRIEQLEKELAQEQEKVNALKNEREKLRQELVVLGHKKGELQREKESLIQIQNRLQSEIATLRNEIALRQRDKETIRELEKENKRLHYELEKMKDLSNTDSFLAQVTNLLEKIHRDWTQYQMQSMKQTQEILVSLRELDREIKGMKPFLTRLDKTKEPSELKRSRVGLFVDTQNIFYAAKDLYQNIVDYEKLKSYVIRDRICHSAIAYVVAAPDFNQSGFTNYLTRLGFEVKTQPLIVRGDGSKKGDVDVNIAIDILGMADKFDILALVSGDGDFVSLLNQLKAKGKKVEVYSFQETTSFRLKEVCDEFYPLGEEVLSSTKSTLGGQ